MYFRTKQEKVGSDLNITFLDQKACAGIYSHFVKKRRKPTVDSNGCDRDGKCEFFSIGNEFECIMVETGE